MENIARARSLTRTSLMVPHPATIRFNRLHNHQYSKIVLPVGHEKRVINTCEISHCTSESNYCNVILTNGERIFLAKTLKWVEARLPKKTFVRCHSSHLVNLTEVTIWCTGHLKIRDTTVIPIARRRKAEVHLALEQHVAQNVSPMAHVFKGN